MEPCSEERLLAISELSLELVKLMHGIFSHFKGANAALMDLFFERGWCRSRGENVWRCSKDGKTLHKRRESVEEKIAWDVFLTVSSLYVGRDAEQLILVVIGIASLWYVSVSARFHEHARWNRRNCTGSHPIRSTVAGRRSWICMLHCRVLQLVRSDGQWVAVHVRWKSINNGSPVCIGWKIGPLFRSSAQERRRIHHLQQQPHPVRPTLTTTHSILDTSHDHQQQPHHHRQCPEQL